MTMLAGTSCKKFWKRRVLGLNGELGYKIVSSLTFSYLLMGSRRARFCYTQAS